MQIFKMVAYAAGGSVAVGLLLGGQDRSKKTDTHLPCRRHHAAQDNKAIEKPACLDRAIKTMDHRSVGRRPLSPRLNRWAIVSWHSTIAL
jgi:hypothetical protein